MTGSHALATLGAGFADPVHAAQRCFRQVLSAMAHPGQVRTLTPDCLAGLAPPDSRRAGHPLGRATTAVLLTVLDAEAPVHLHGELDSPAARTYLRFHAGAAWAEAALAPWSVLRAADLDLAWLDRLPGGDDEVPQAGATLLIEVPGLDDQSALPGAQLLRLHGPGIECRQDLAVQGLPAAFWAWRQAQEARFPRGIDLLLCCGDRLAALPRSTHLTLEA